MKIILAAFNNTMWSKPMDVPDNASPDFYLPLPMDVLAYNKKNNSLDTVSAISKRGHWRRTGRSYALMDGITPAEGERPYAYEYVLVDIS
jgi:hypothetical protein